MEITSVVKKVECAINRANNRIITKEKLPARSIVVINREKYTLFSIEAKCREIDNMSVLKSLTKAVLSCLKVQKAKNSTAASVYSGKKVSSHALSEALRGHIVGVVDKKGRVVPESLIEVPETDTIGKHFKFTDKHELYDLIVNCGAEWHETRVVNHLKAWCAATCEQWNVVRDFAYAIQSAAESTYEEACTSVREERAKATAEREAKRKTA